MVELRLDNIGSESIPKDCFISVRLGETQKISKLSSGRVFRFPHAEKGNRGKIEIFKRIGYATVDIDPKLGDFRDVSVDCENSSSGKLDLRICVETKGMTKLCANSGGKQAASRNESDCIEKEKLQGKMRVAQEYVMRHRIEAHLAEAMQTVLREQPDNPTEFIAHKLIAAGALNPKVTSHDKVQVDTTQFQTTNDLLVTSAGLQLKSSRHPTLERETKTREAVVNDRTAFIQAHNVSGVRRGGRGNDALERRFEHLPSVGSWHYRPARARAAEHRIALADDVAIVDCQHHFRSLPSVATWCLPRRHVLSFLLQQQKQQQMQVQVKVPTEMELQVHRQEQKRQQQQQQQHLVYKSVKNHHRRLPSVGTWMLPRERMTAHELQRDEPQAIRSFYHMPSVGTWFASSMSISRSMKERRNSKADVDTLNQTPLLRVSPLLCEPTTTCEIVSRSLCFEPSVATSTTRHSSVTAVVNCSDSKTCRFALLPSVGNWLVPRNPRKSTTESSRRIAHVAKAMSNQETTPRCFHHMPSVSTWLVSGVRLGDVGMVSKVKTDNRIDVDAKFERLPSVCTWFSQRVRFYAAAEESTKVGVPRSLSCLFSVDTCFTKPILVLSTSCSDADSSLAKPLESKNDENCDFFLQPSVGTWLAPRRTKLVLTCNSTGKGVNKQEFRRLPSVCTWLSLRRSAAVALETSDAEQC